MTTPAGTNIPRSQHHVVLGAGPVGHAVVAHLLADGITPTVVTRSGTEVPGAVARQADITAGHELAAAIAGADVVYQCAQPAYHRWQQEFPQLQAGVIDAVATSGSLLVVVENLYGYGDVNGPLTEHLSLSATTKKGTVRALMSLDLVEAHQSGRLRMVVARASDFFGPYVDGSAFGERFVSQVKAGKKVDLLGDPDALHSVTYVPDLAAAMVRLAAEPDSWGRAWHVPNAPAVSQRTLVELAARAAGTSPMVRRVAKWQLRAIGTFVPPMREMVEMAYEFEHDFVVDHSDYVRSFGDHSTPLVAAFDATMRSEITTIAGAA
ncbi:MAG TPA: NAD-dependent epimerase/dehydratase family protein [Ilumatobacteraceae bacterium]|nr:NAD-dependent epimerase/dehydratase family protein [Ilumatobacteraceae bacterium]